MRNRRSRLYGVTLIELMISLTLMGVLAMMAVPAMSGMLNSFRVDSATRAMIASLQLARNEAAMRGGRVVVCKSSNGSDCSHTKGWEQGWIVFRDGNNNAVVDQGEPILHREPAMPEALSFTGNVTVVSYVSYTPYGHANMTNGAFQAGTLTVCSPSKRGFEARQIVINSTGRARTQMATLDHCA
jgi:type IV fimbrial biogenesis protein FimT